MTPLSAERENEVKRAIGARLAEERVRLGFRAQPQLAARTGLAKRTLAGWEIGEGALKAESLAVLAEAGIDVLYVLTGRRGAALGAEESKLVQLYLRIPNDKRPALIGMAQALASDVPPAAPASPVTQTFHGPVGSIHAVHQGTMHNRYTESARVPVKKRAK